jgi:signal transduction histidine kinase
VRRLLTDSSSGVQSIVLGDDTDLAESIRAVRLRDRDGVQILSEQPARRDDPRSFGPGLLVALPVFAGRSSTRLGTLDVELAVSTLLGDALLRASPLGAVIAALDPSSSASLLPLPFDASLLEHERFRWGGEEWITSRRMLAEPPLILVAAAPVTPLTAPFEDAATRGLIVLFVVAGAAIVAAAVLTARMTRSLDRLATAADAVARGRIDQRVEPVGSDEIGRVAHAFNAMTESLRRTLRELADRQALAAVGEFAASLSHEVRNALSSIRLDMQVTGEQLPADVSVREPYRRALREIERLDQTVTGSLELARSGRLTKVELNLWTPLHAAAVAARSEFTLRRAHLDVPPASAEPIVVTGDAASLEQLFLNVLLNAAQALGDGGTATVRVGVHGTAVSITVADDGRGIPQQELDRVFDAFYSTRDGGTGLGLPISRRIAQAHGGQLRIQSTADAGTVVEIALPLSM